MNKRIANVDRADVQGLVFYGYRGWPFARYAFYEVTQPETARRFIESLIAHVTTSASERGRTRLNIAITGKGLEALRFESGLPDGTSQELRDGMVTPHKQRVLGDTGRNDPKDWDWGAEARPVHLLVMTFAQDPVDLGAFDRTEGVSCLKRIDSWPLPDQKEHFGFRDGIAQPTLATSTARDANSIALGEVLLGYPNEYDRIPTSPTIEASDDPREMLTRAGDRADFGKNGSYFVVRQLEQDVHAFWSALAKTEDPVRLAAKMVGRWPSGAPLAVAPDADDPALATHDRFGYAGDPWGERCPIGAHVRRTNPRDFLGEGVDEAPAVVRRHRLLRRGRTYGPPLHPSMDPASFMKAPRDDVERGLLFGCLNANIGRQFEFVQQTWMNNPKFLGLYGDVDPIVGRQTSQIPTTFTEPAQPIRRRACGFPEFVTVRGGAYFFLPSMRALRWLVSV